MTLLTTGNTLAADAELLGNASVEGGLNPLPAEGSVLLSGAIDFDGEDDFFDDVDYVGAFDTADFWAAGWTALDHYGWVAEIGTSSLDEPAALAAGDLRVFPNPTAGRATVAFSLVREADVRIALFDLDGRLIRSDVATLGAGDHRAAVETAGLAPGTYVLRLVAGGSVASSRLSVF